MSVIAIVGAGPGLGMATARRFGREGFKVALISRSKEKLDALVEELSGEGIDARGYVADITVRDTLPAALDAAARDLGTVEVLQFSPIPARDYLKTVLETTPEDLEAATAFSIIGSSAAIRHVLPAMEELGRGTVLLVNGGSAVNPNPTYAGTSVAFAGESAYGQMLHDAVAEVGIHIGQLIVPGAIDGPDPLFASAVLADRLWAIHTSRGGFRETVGE